MADINRTDILRVAQHMRQRGIALADKMLGRAFCEAADLLDSEARRLQECEAGRICGGTLAYEQIGGMRLCRDGRYRFRCVRCAAEGENDGTPRECLEADRGA